jgi:hypothetical protein
MDYVIESISEFQKSLNANAPGREGALKIG